MKAKIIRGITPWFHPDSIKFLFLIIKPDWIVFETGSGRSTIWFARNAKKVISYEHSELYYNKVRRLIDEKGIKNVDLQLRPNYPKEGIRGFGRNEFDLVSIDGPRDSRVKCVKAVIPCLKSGGYLLFDDSEYRCYKEAINLLKDWEEHIFGGTRRHATTIWRKP